MPRRRRYDPHYYQGNTNDVKIPPWFAGLLLISFLLYLVWIYVVKPAINYVKEHSVFFWILGLSVVGLLVVVFIIYIVYLYKEEEKKAIFEKKQIKQGLIKFVDRFGNERWGAPEDVKKWTQEDAAASEKEKLINQIISEIGDFQPAKKYQNEFPYQVELVGYLKAKFPHAGIERQKGSSRPDIVVGDVAIEVKGPTRTKDLQTIADKCLRYYQHFGELIIVLFEVDVYEPRYNEWKKGIENIFPSIKIIRK